MTELERLVRELLETWDTWVDADEWGGADLDRLADVIRLLREEIAKQP